MSLAEIQKAIEELDPEEEEELREWLDGYDPAMEREWAAIAQERIRQIKSGEVTPVDGEQVLRDCHEISVSSYGIIRTNCIVPFSVERVGTNIDLCDLL